MNGTRRGVVLCVFLQLLAGSAWLGSEPGWAAAPQVKLAPEAVLRQLEKDIAAVRGLEFKTPVVARVIARPKDAAPKVQGYYSTKEKALYLYDDVSGAYERGVLVHEMVHALQDQHFSLSKLHQTEFGSDAELARAALIEGDATYTMIELLKKEQPRVAAMLDAPLEKAKDVRNAFLYAQGARYVKALKERGGWAAVNLAYRLPPRSTAAILHPEGVRTIDLGPGKTRGELAILQMFAAHPETAAQAVQAAAGWKGDKEMEDGPAQSWVVAFTTAEDAQQFQTALTRLRASQSPPAKGLVEEPGANVWQDEKGAFHAVLVREDRVHALDAPDERTYRALRDRLETLPPLRVVAAKEPTTLTFGQLSDRLLEADLICIGESHDSDLHHRVQLQIIKALFARDERLGVGLEMFQRPFQKELDRYVRGESAEDEFLKATEYRQRWGFDWGLYRPIVEFCRRNGVPLAALNAPRELTSKISKTGFAGLTADEQVQLGPIDFQVKGHRDHWFELLPKLHGRNNATPEEKERSYQVMAVWDDYMAASAATFQQTRRLRRLVVLAGSGHVERGFGIPERAARRTGGKVLTVRIEVGGVPEKAAEPLADFTVYVDTGAKAAAGAVAAPPEKEE